MLISLAVQITAILDVSRAQAEVNPSSVISFNLYVVKKLQHFNASHCSPNTGTHVPQTDLGLIAH